MCVIPTLPYLFDIFILQNNVPILGSIFSSKDLLITICWASICCMSVGLSIRIFFTFLTPFPELLGQSQLNLVQSINSYTNLKFVKMKGHLFQEGIIRNWIIEKLLTFFKNLSLESTGIFNSCGSIRRWCRFMFVQIMIPGGRIEPQKEGCQNY